MNAPPFARILLLHPGEMGAAIGALLRARGAEVLWLPEGRGAASAARAGAAGLAPRADLARAAAEADLVVSVCPPHAAPDVAAAVAATGFAGTYLDANAVAPATARAIAARLAPARVVDGGIAGPPPGPGCTTRLYLSGAGAAEVAALFQGSPLRPVLLDAPTGAASAVKMAVGGWTKGRSALALALRAYVRAEGVEAAYLAAFEEWSREDGPRPAPRAVAKAWRFEGEMREVAAALAAAGLPPGFHAAAAEIFAALGAFRDAGEVDLDAALDALAEPGGAAAPGAWAWIDAGPADLAPEGARRLDHGGRSYAVFRGLEDGIYCTEGLCPHEAAHLARGAVSGTVVECPRHGARFDVRTGAARGGGPPCRDLARFETRRRAGRIEVRLPG